MKTVKNDNFKFLLSVKYGIKNDKPTTTYTIEVSDDFGNYILERYDNNFVGCVYRILEALDLYGYIKSDDNYDELYNLLIKMEDELCK